MFTYFKNGVHNSKPAKEYLQSRCLDFTKTEVGYNSGQFHHGARKDEALIKSCINYGLLLDLGGTARTGNPAYRSFGKLGVVFPLKNKEHQIVSLYFRSIIDNKNNRHFYLKQRQGLYPNYPSTGAKRLILTESIIDAASLLEQDKIKNNYEILSLFGTNGFTKEHTEAVSQLKELTEIIFFLNGDQAGITAVEKYAPMLKAEYPNLIISNVAVPENEDVNSLLQGHSGEILHHLMNTRKEYSFLFSSETEGSVNTIENKQGVNQNTVEKEKPTAEVERLDTQLLKAERVEAVQEQEPIKKEEPQTIGLNTNNPYNLKYQGNEARYQIKGFKINQLDSLKITLQIRDNKGSLTLKLDLYEFNQVEKSCKTVAEKLGLSRDLIEQDLERLTNLLEFYKDKQLHQKQGENQKKVSVPTATATKCITFLKRENLIEEFNKLIGKAGITGEQVNRILLFVIASSYKMPDTLHALIQGSSGSGKTRLLRIISDMMPSEDVKKYTRVTDNSFYNQDEYFFVNKLVCFEDMDGLKEDAQLAVRELQSNEILRTSTSLKDKNGSITGGERIVRGPIASMSCTTNGEMYEDNVSRSFLIAVDESAEQTIKIINYQNQRAAGGINKEDEKRILNFVQNCMRLLQPYEVINLYATKIKLPDEAHKIRRLNELYQSFVRQITLLNQYQRKRDRQGRLLSQKEDLQTACDILFESILLKVDELDGSLRQFFERLKSYLIKKSEAENNNQSDTDFTQREIRQALNISKAQCSRNIGRLRAMEYVSSTYSNNQRKVKYKIDYWDNYAKLRAKIKDNLNNQISEI
jgi:energy-coupling factor transporter ATP-binding protein EcfA2